LQLEFEFPNQGGALFRTGAEVCTGAELAAATCGFFLAASTDEAERAKAAMAMNDTNLVIISSPKKQQ
jgi:hypothetical protein